MDIHVYIYVYCISVWTQVINVSFNSQLLTLQFAH